MYCVPTAHGLGVAVATGRGGAAGWHSALAHSQMSLFDPVSLLKALQALKIRHHCAR
jgi:hypothetical protein